jgi:hypothetical protein
MYGAAVKDPPVRQGTTVQTEGRIRQLRRSLDVITDERDRLSRLNRWRLLGLGVAISVLVHIALMMYLNALHRRGDEPGVPEAVSYEFAIVQEEELTQLETTELDDLLPELKATIEEMPDAPAQLEAAVAAAELEITGTGSLPTLGGSGQGGEGMSGLAGAGAATSFFGISSRGSRFAYVVDISGSMGNDRKLYVAMRELGQSIRSLPDYAHFFILLFSDSHRAPPMQQGWTRARRSAVQTFVRWFNDVDPGGGTNPRSALATVFSLENRPDVLFFLTDGQIPNLTTREVADMQGRGKRIIINTIAFGDPSSQDLLKEIAQQSGGVYRFVPTGNK